MILSCQNISKAFVENQVLKNVSFHIEDHEKAAIVGINGAGKTTLLRIIVGEMTPDDGQVVLAGIMMIDTLDRFIGRDFNNVHTVNITELLFLCECCTSHTGLFVKFVKEVLE